MKPFREHLWVCKAYKVTRSRLGVQVELSGLPCTCGADERAGEQQ